VFRTKGNYFIKYNKEKYCVKIYLLLSYKNMSIDNGTENLQNSTENTENKQSFLTTKLRLAKSFLKKINDTSKAIVQDEGIKNNMNELMEIQKRDLILTGLIATNFLKIDGLKGEVLKKSTEIAVENTAKNKIDLHPNVPDWFKNGCQKVGLAYPNVFIAPHALQLIIDRSVNTFKINKEMTISSINIAKNIYKPDAIQQVKESPLEFKDKK